MTDETGIVKVGSIFDAGWKIFIPILFLIGVVFDATLLWVNTQSNTKDIVTMKEQIDKLATQSSLQGVQDQVTKQYSNLKDLDNKINANAKTADDRVDALEKNAYYQEGYDAAVKELKKK